MYRRLKYERESKNIMQMDVAKNVLKISKSQFSLYEAENVTIPIKHLVTLCNYYNVSLDYIFEFTNTKQYKNIIFEVDKKKAGERLKEFRKNNKLTQKDLAKILNTTFSTVSSYELGINLLSTNYLYTISSKYNISADYLLGRLDEKNSTI